MDNSTQDIIATSVSIQNGMISLDLADGSTHAFPVYYYPRLCQATQAELEAVVLRVGGRALRWTDLDEDIWIADAIFQNYPKHKSEAVAEAPAKYN
jgi:hypothetical protein